MASPYFKKFAIDHQLTADYGYIFGWYQNFYISIKEGLSYKILTIITKLGEKKDLLKEVLQVFENDLEKFCLTDNRFENTYLQFTFNLNHDKSSLVIDFLNRFIQSYHNHNLKVETICPICNRSIDVQKEKIDSINYSGIITPVHENCYNHGKEKIEKKVQENIEKVNKDRSTSKGVLGAILFGLILIILMIAFYSLKELLLSEYTQIGEEGLRPEGSANLFHYLPSLLGLAAPFLVDAGYNLFKGTKGNTRFGVVIIVTYVATIIGIWFGFTLSISFLISDFSYFELVPLILQMIGAYPSFRTSFVLFAVLTLVFTTIGILLKFANSKEARESEISTFDKLN